MGKYYQCDLLQVSSEQGSVGYDECGLSLSTEMQLLIYYNVTSKDGDCNFGRIIVEETDDPYFVKEIITGIKIPLLYSNIFVELGMESRIGLKFWTDFPYNNVHTFVRFLQTKICSEEFEYYCYEPVTPADIEEYFNINNNSNYKKEISDFFKQGEKKKKKADYCNISNSINDKMLTGHIVRKLTQ